MVERLCRPWQSNTSSSRPLRRIQKSGRSFRGTPLFTGKLPLKLAQHRRRRSNKACRHRLYDLQISINRWNGTARSNIGTGTRRPYAIVMKNRSVFGFAGLWERCMDRASVQAIQSRTLITTTHKEARGPLVQMPYLQTNFRDPGVVHALRRTTSHRVRRD